MRLYVWNNARVLRQYSSGIAFALAENEEEARALILAPIHNRRRDLFGECCEPEDLITGIEGPADHIHETTERVAYHLEGSE